MRSQPSKNVDNDHHKAQTCERPQRNRGRETNQNTRFCGITRCRYHILRRETTGKGVERDLWKESDAASQKAFVCRFQGDAKCIKH